ncbi:MAG: CBS domain-containing protein [Thaumarchaeota archaeon]|nr:CBS domain-containing protein [Nitrososphaerota archaeon]
MEKVADLMSKGSIYTISPHETVEAAAKKMKTSSKGCLVVIDGARPVAMLTERDIVQKYVASGLKPGSTVGDIMSSPLVTIGPKASISEAARLMAKSHIRRLAVVDKEALVGILTVTDMARHVEHAGITDYIRAVIGRGELLQTQEAVM